MLPCVLSLISSSVFSVEFFGSWMFVDKKCKSVMFINMFSSIFNIFLKHALRRKTLIVPQVLLPRAGMHSTMAGGISQILSLSIMSLLDPVFLCSQCLETAPDQRLATEWAPDSTY